MPRSTGSITSRRLLLDIASVVRETRMALGWSQADLARRCGLTQSMISKVERCDRDSSVGAIGTTLDALGVRPELKLRVPFIDRHPQGDAVHRRCAAYVRRRVEAAGWTVAEEVEIVDGRMPGWIDVLAFDPKSGCVLVGEVKAELHDLGEIERTMGWYERSAWRASARLGWRPRSVVGILFVLATSPVEQRLVENAAAVKRVYRIRGTGLHDWLEKEPHEALGGAASP